VHAHFEPCPPAQPGTVSPSELERAAIRELVVAARARGEDLTGPDGLLKLLTRTVLETALEEELTEHLGYDKHATEGRTGGNSRNGKRTKTVVTDAVGQVEIEVPRDRDGTFAPVGGQAAGFAATLPRGAVPVGRTR
jgi:putative transposase